MLLLDRRDAETEDRVPVRSRVAERRPTVCVVFATRGRPDLLARTVAALQRQTLEPASIIVSCVVQADATGLAPRPDLVVLYGSPGLAAQRNRALRHLPAETDYVVFFDDDFLPRSDWLETVARTFADQPDVGAITGLVIVDGIKGPGLSFDDALGLLADDAHTKETWIREQYIPYGCNMAFRRSAIVGHFFDERLVLYGWLEDRDFGEALAEKGFRIVKIGAAAGVHMGVKSGRVSGLKLGYSQIVNPLYLHRKGTMPLRAMADHVFRNVSSNIARALFPEPYIDRIGRLRGNLRGLADVLRGRLTPERAADL